MKTDYSILEALQRKLVENAKSMNAQIQQNEEKKAFARQKYMDAIEQLMVKERELEDQQSALKEAYRRNARALEDQKRSLVSNRRKCGDAYNMELSCIKSSHRLVMQDLQNERSAYFQQYRELGGELSLVVDPACGNRSEKLTDGKEANHE